MVFVKTEVYMLHMLCFHPIYNISDIILFETVLNKFIFDMFCIKIISHICCQNVTNVDCVLIKNYNTSIINDFRNFINKHTLLHIFTC